MIYRVALTTRAEDDRDRAFNWYAENYSRDFAVRWYDGLMKAVESLQQNPFRCSSAHERYKFPFDLRELRFGRRLQKGLVHRIAGAQPVDA